MDATDVVTVVTQSSTEPRIHVYVSGFHFSANFFLTPENAKVMRDQLNAAIEAGEYKAADADVLRHG